MLISYWKLWWRRWSTWLAAVNATFVTYVFSQPVLVIGLLGFSPGEWLIPMALFLGFAAFILPVIVAHLRQPKLEEKKGELDAKG